MTNMRSVLVMGNNTYILPMGEAKEPLAAPVHCLHRSVWAATKSQFVQWNVCQDFNLVAVSIPDFWCQ